MLADGGDLRAMSSGAGSAVARRDRHVRPTGARRLARRYQRHHRRRRVHDLRRQEHVRHIRLDWNHLTGPRRRVFFFKDICTVLTFVFMLWPGCSTRLYCFIFIFTFAAAGHRRPLVGTNLYCLVTESHVCEQPVRGCYLKVERPGLVSRTRDLLSRESSAIITTLPG